MSAHIKLPGYYHRSERKARRKEEENNLGTRVGPGGCHSTPAVQNIIQIKNKNEGIPEVCEKQIEEDKSQC